MERHVPDVVDQHLLELADVHEVACLEDSLEFSLQAADGVAEELEPDETSIVEDLVHLLVGSNPHDGSHDGPRRTSRDDSREELLGCECLDDSEVVHAEARPPAQHQSRLAEGVSALCEKLETLLERQKVLRGVGDLPQQPSQHSLMLADQILRSHVRLVVKARVTDASQVADEPAAKRSNDGSHVLLSARPLHLLEALADQL
mmetsp:Transcript_34486/g.67492  ORF Transcript_34486/g.67492 Transcript_34486/m.67492 type:complete len:203 (-) Transcript_34486:220-828(-)